MIRGVGALREGRGLRRCVEAGQDADVWKVISEYLLEQEKQRCYDEDPEDPAFPPGPHIIIRRILDHLDEE